ncbi:unnamed protein product (macronuclear) [Paramecium tetraurelia]|uniref:Uncharacterized protein n=1 Tax=Paramecium tetraurelia TaxID=5888 RepID=A0DHM3_PARTE|nr:uncharacterized protein GSPATT00016927001 [Paramecium tetraurelia]CAK82540.1 unnamed protein product [Paramecium tetraurelia]|eukprot:XP_001449937.1 hypothetical protein (macronuclear) [Paramecium tetraurelia strain d4-2]
MNQGQQSQQQQNGYHNPIEDQLNYKNYYRVMVFLFAILVILGIMQTHQFTQHRREKLLTFL